MCLLLLPYAVKEGKRGISPSKTCYLFCYARSYISLDEGMTSGGTLFLEVVKGVRTSKGTNKTEGGGGDRFVLENAVT